MRLVHAWALLLGALLQPLPLAMAANGGGWAQEGWLKAMFVPALLLQATAALLLVSLMSSVLVWRCTGNHLVRNADTSHGPFVAYRIQLSGWPFLHCGSAAALASPP